MYPQLLLINLHRVNKHEANLPATLPWHLDGKKVSETPGTIKNYS